MHDQVDCLSHETVIVPTELNRCTLLTVLVRDNNFASVTLLSVVGIVVHWVKPIRMPVSHIAKSHLGVVSRLDCSASHQLPANGS